MEIQLRNQFLEVRVRSDLGGRIDQIIDRKASKEWLWHPPGHDPSATRDLKIGSSFDAAWTGGWDEVFPNDAAGHFQGRNLVDHGELWSQRWQVVESSAVGAKLAVRCQTVPVSVEKTILLDEHSPHARIEYLIRNHSTDTIPFMLKMHPAIAIEEGDELLLPDCEIEPVDLGFSRIIGRAGRTRFPKAMAQDGSEVRIDRIQPRVSKLREFVYASSLAQGECGIRNPRTNTTFHLKFPPEQFPFVWVFQSYGGFGEPSAQSALGPTLAENSLGHYVIVLEPCTTKPYDLAAAWRLGTTPILHPIETKRFAMEFSIS